MRCFSCASLSFKIICKMCETQLFVPNITKRTVGTLEVISFFKYSTLEDLLLTKHKPEGHRIYRELSKITVQPFIKKFAENYKKDVYIIGIDENVASGYSHVALLTQSMKREYVKPLHGALMARNKVKYSGKSLEFRLWYSRAFVYKGKNNIDAILVDDIITTGITLQEAYNVLTQSGVNVLFALTLADVEE
ncbi:MAG TPA: ComF family protein [Sulfurovum sp.]|nr:ComF family protein [Sulfurovum sp.]